MVDRRALNNQRPFSPARMSALDVPLHYFGKAI
jgi:hypothetical protein